MFVKWSGIYKRYKLLISVVAGLVVLISFYTGIKQILGKTKVEISIAPLIITYDDTHTVCFVDIRLVNNSERTAVINKVLLEATELEIGRTEPLPGGGPLPVSAQYDIDIGKYTGKETSLNTTPHIP